MLTTRSLPFAWALAVAMTVAAGSAANAQSTVGSPACQAANAGSYDFTNGPAGAPYFYTARQFFAGEKFTYSVKSLVVTPSTFSFGFNNPAADNLVADTVINNNETKTGSFTVTTGGTFALGYTPPGLNQSNVTIRCDIQTASGTEEERERRELENFNLLLMKAYFDRLTKSMEWLRNRSSGGQGAETGSSRGAAGGAGKSALDGLSLWANGSWVRSTDDNAAAAGTANMYIGMAGADYALSQDLLVGGGLTFMGTDFESRGGQKLGEFALGINPYLVYKLTDSLSVDAIAGYQRAIGEITRSSGASGDYDSDRYFAATNLSFARSFGDARLMTSAGLSVGQAFTHSYRDNRGAEMDGSKTNFGNMRLLAQPSYTVLLDRQAKLFLEPFALGEWSYDYLTTKIDGHSNDRDGFRVGGGANIYSGVGLSGSIQGTTMLGREDRRETQVQGTVRWSF